MQNLIQMMAESKDIFTANDTEAGKLKINKNMTIAELMTVDPMIPNILVREGMHCVTCGAAPGETLEQAGGVHGMTDDQINNLVDRINDFLSVL